ncbi:MAG: hypothetical protein Q4B68_03860 [Bacteroidales bacterium]|nr:hypothetical protein [Bacteroidales bacterium]
MASLVVAWGDNSALLASLPDRLDGEMGKSCGLLLVCIFIKIVTFTQNFSLREKIDNEWLSGGLF